MLIEVNVTKCTPSSHQPLTRTLLLSADVCPSLSFLPCIEFVQRRPEGRLTGTNCGTRTTYSLNSRTANHARYRWAHWTKQILESIILTTRPTRRLVCEMGKVEHNALTTTPCSATNAFIGHLRDTFVSFLWFSIASSVPVSGSLKLESVYKNRIYLAEIMFISGTSIISAPSTRLDFDKPTVKVLRSTEQVLCYWPRWQVHRTYRVTPWF